MVETTSFTISTLLSTAVFLSTLTSYMCHQHTCTSLLPEFNQTNMMTAGKHMHVYSSEKCNSLKDMWRSFIHGISFHSLRIAHSAVKTALCSAVKTALCSAELVYQYFW